MTHVRRMVIHALLLFMATTSAAQADAPDRGVDSAHYRAHLAPDIPRRTLDSKVEITLRGTRDGVDALMLDAGELEILEHGDPGPKRLAAYAGRRWQQPSVQKWINQRGPPH